MKKIIIIIGVLAFLLPNVTWGQRSGAKVQKNGVQGGGGLASVDSSLFTTIYHDNATYLKKSDTTTSWPSPLVADSNQLNVAGNYPTVKYMFEYPYQDNLQKVYRKLNGDVNLLLPIGTNIQTSFVSGTGLLNNYIYFTSFYTEKSLKMDSVGIALSVLSTCNYKGFHNKLGLYTWNPANNIATLVDSTVSAVPGIADSTLFRSSATVTIIANEPLVRAWASEYIMPANSFFYVAIIHSHSSFSGTNPSVLYSSSGSTMLNGILAHIRPVAATGVMTYTAGKGTVRLSCYYSVGGTLPHLPATIDLGATTTVGSTQFGIFLYSHL